MEGQTGWFVALIILALAQALVLALRMKKNNPGTYGERIASLETEVKNMKEDIKEIKEKLNRK